MFNKDYERVFRNLLNGNTQLMQKLFSFCTFCLTLPSLANLSGIFIFDKNYTVMFTHFDLSAPKIHHKIYEIFHGDPKD